jgi:hypothetical protein
MLLRIPMGRQWKDLDAMTAHLLAAVRKLPPDEKRQTRWRGLANCAAEV